MKTTYRVDGKKFDYQTDAIAYVRRTHFPTAINLAVEYTPDRDGWNIQINDEDTDQDTVTIYINQQ
jgi:hypothetical protein